MKPNCRPTWRSRLLQETYKPAILHGYMQSVFARNLHVLFILGFHSSSLPPVRTPCTGTACGQATQLVRGHPEAARDDRTVDRKLAFYDRSGDTCLLVVTLVYWW